MRTKSLYSKIFFTKMVASGNDFVLIEHIPGVSASRLEEFARKICHRKYGIGADGLLYLEKSRAADIRMRIFNADGSEAEMCGNGARCLAAYLNTKFKILAPRIETKAGIIDARIKDNNIKIKLTQPLSASLDIPLQVNQRQLNVNFINTGVPHTVIFTEGLNNIDVFGIGRQIRYHEHFKPAGTNVNFIEVLDENYIAVRTYERGVEGETLACGTGSVASALIFALKADTADRKIKVLTKSMEVLSVYFDKTADTISNVWLEGKACIVFEGITRLGG